MLCAIRSISDAKKTEQALLYEVAEAKKDAALKTRFLSNMRFAGSEPGYYDMIPMDIMMPRLNGWDAARKMRSLKRTDAGTIPIVAMSANAFAEDIINSRTSGMNVHLAKPLDEKKLIETLWGLFV